MILRQPSPDDSKQRKEKNKKKSSMGQLSSSEMPAAMVSAAGKAAVTLQQASSTTAASINTSPRNAPENGHGPSPLMRTASKPIDIRRGPAAQWRAPLAVAAAPLPRAPPPPLLQRSASEMGTEGMGSGGGHQPRVIQPRRLAATTPGGTIGMGPQMSAGSGIMMQHNHTATSSIGRHCRHGHGNQRRPRGTTVDIPLMAQKQQQQLPEECTEGPMGGKENGEDREGEKKKNSKSRKRANSAELEYDALEGTSTECAEKTMTPEGGENPKSEMAITTKAEADDERRMERDGNGGADRRKPQAGQGSRIAYLYGVYGAADTNPPARVPRRSAFADQANFGYSSSPPAYWDDCCCFEEDDEDGDEEEMARHDSNSQCCVVHNLHTVSDIIGYAKVVRAQRNETLGRLNDVMSQFDALIRSYSKAMRTPQNGAADDGGNGAAGTIPGQTKLTLMTPEAEGMPATSE